MEWRDDGVEEAGLEGCVWGRPQCIVVERGNESMARIKTVREVGCRNSCTRFIHHIHRQVGSNAFLLSLFILPDEDKRLVYPGSPGSSA